MLLLRACSDRLTAIWTGLRSKRQPGWRCAACWLDPDGLRVNPGIWPERGPGETSVTGRIGPSQQARRRFRRFKPSGPALAGWLATRQFEYPMRAERASGWTTLPVALSDRRRAIVCSRAAIARASYSP
jgi:hypothetical protein